MKTPDNSARMPVRIDGPVTVVVTKDAKAATVSVGGVDRVVDPTKTQVFKDADGTIISTLYFDTNGDFAGEA
jgi:hypothetical protein